MDPSSTWVQNTDVASGKTYYYNTATGETSMDNPVLRQPPRHVPHVEGMLGDIPLVEAVVISEAVPLPSFNVESSAHSSSRDPAIDKSNSSPQAPRPAQPGAGVLLTRNIPSGLVDSISQAATQCAKRYWIIDNSGSMAITDGQVIVPSKQGQFTKIGCSRWEELVATMKWHAQTAAALQAPTEFRLLNPPNNGAPIKVLVDGSNTAEQLAQLDFLSKASPSGGTPLCAAIRAVVSEIQARASALRAAGQRVVVVLATDGEPSDGKVAEALQPLVGLPCSVIVRLCTDDERVGNYWGDIDKDLELELDVLDDLAGEGKEVHAFNPWLAYAEPLHRAREWGVAEKVVDFLDERRLHPAEAARMVTFIFGEAAGHLPNPQVDPKEFAAGLRKLLAATPSVFDCDTGKTVPWINVASLSSSVLRESSRGKGGGGGGGGGCCSIS